MVSKSDSGLGTDAFHVYKTPACSDGTLPTVTPCHAAWPWQHSVITLPDAIVVIYAVSGSILYAYSIDGGTSWTTVTLAVTPTACMGVSAVADVCTQDIHMVYGRVGDPILSAESPNSIYYRKLTYTGSPLMPSWSDGGEVEVALGGAGIGYASPVIAVERRGCGYTSSVEYGDGRLVMMCLRKTFTTRSWAVFTASAPWTLQGAAETPAAISTAAANDRASIGVVGGYLFALTFAGGVYALYRSSALAWGTTSLTFSALDGFSGDDEDEYAMASDMLESGTDTDGVVSEDRTVAAAYVKNSQARIRQWIVPATGDVTVTDSLIWPITPVVAAGISRVGTTYRVTLILNDQPASTVMSVIYSDGPPYTTWFCIGESAGGALWHSLRVPEHATSGYDWAAAWTQQGVPNSTVRYGRCPMELLQLVNMAGAGTDTYILTMALADTGSGADTIALLIPITDTGAGAHTVLIRLALADTGEGSDVAGLVRTVEDSGGSSSEVVTISLAVSDTGSGADVPTIIINVPDTGSGADSIINSPTLLVTDTGAGVDVVSELRVLVTDTGSGSDVPLIAIELADTGSGTDVASIILNVSDAGAGAEIIDMLFNVADAGSGAEALGLELQVTDTGAGTDVPTIILNITDTGVGLDQASVAILVALTTLRLLVAKGVVRLNVKGPGI